MNESMQLMKESLKAYWESFIMGVPKIILAIVMIIIGFLLANIISRFFKKTYLLKTQDPLMVNFLSKTVKLAVLTLVIMMALKVAGLQGVATGLLTAAGASAVIIGFAFKDVGENFISGIILSFNRPFDVDDTIMVDNIFGKIKSLEFRYTKVKTFDGRDVYIPNSDIIKKAVYNYTEDGFFRLDFMVGIDYEDDIDTAKKVILETVRSSQGVFEDEEHECFVVVDSLGVSTVNLKILFWAQTKEYRKRALEVKSTVVRNVKQVIMENGFNMPADITEIKLYGSQTSIPVTVDYKIRTKNKRG
ncbi:MULTISPECIES: mechanosensitive ion channel family protein [Bizionia]|uniref:Mechanosensitive ion channel family protein n=1 Tax=Bizionia algoritergicola TaxID=291187 RepID=A0A5D0R1J5_9FLAO|nr:MULTISPECIES: mechanosensitive ion channel family protein [Bizionia]OBX23673.1 mechanosensitive ion channel protein MscS [Bizionia sp. APA-3]TYB75393.1 mechanosensitive ion channel family protein [Bizionia algoritergicola]